MKTTIAALILFAAGPACATMLASGALQSTVGSRLICRITNLGTGPLAADVFLLRASDGAHVIATGGTCAGGSIPPGGSCEFYTQDVATRTGYCRVSAPGSKFRGSLLVENTTTGVVTSSLPLTR